MSGEETFKPLRFGRNAPPGSATIPGGYPSLLRGRIAKPCPRCEAVPGQRCQRWIPEAGLWRSLKKFHAERRAS
jgi:hypothetical protein